jgi:hypothetical protein
VESLWITKAAAGKTRRLFEWGRICAPDLHTQTRNLFATTRTKPQTTPKVAAPKVSKGRSESPLVAPAGAIPSATIKIKKHGSVGEAIQRATAKPSGRLRRGEIPATKKTSTEKRNVPDAGRLR